MMVSMHKYKRLIVFFIPPEKIVNGGILSIFSICKESRRFKNIHHSEVVLSTYPGTKSYRNNDLFKNDEVIYSFDEIVKKGIPRSLQLHVPEYASLDVFLGLKKYINYLETIPELSVNIMTQNIWLLQKPFEVANWFLLTPKVTQTVAHDKSATQKLADQYYLPTHLLSVFNDPRQYKWTLYENKQNLILLSPDNVEKRQPIIRKLKKQFPLYKIVTVQNMRYEEYKDLTSQAKFTITFGEGFDGYYIESFFCGGIAFAVYNNDFFPNKDFSKFENTYSSYDDMSKSIVEDIKSLDNKSRYEEVVDKNFKQITELYNFSAYIKNLENFYRYRYSYLPGKDSAKQLIASVLTELNRVIEETELTGRRKDLVIEKQQAAIRHAIEKHQAVISEKDQMIHNILNSRSWKVTKPLRLVSHIVRRKLRSNRDLQP